MVNTRIPAWLAVAMLLPATGLFSACAAKQPHELSPPSEPVKVSAAMSETTSSSLPAAGGSTLTSQEAGHRLLKLIDGLKTPAEAGEVAKRLRGGIVRRGFGSDELRPLSAATGFAMFPADGRTVDELLGVADTDLFAAKPGERQTRGRA